jgi:hypothetical protein
VGKVYGARITDQAVKTFPDGNNQVFQLIVTVRILNMLKDDKDPAGETEPCPEEEREVWVKLDPEDPDSLRRASRELERLGFTDDDISRLHPEHPNCFRLVDRQVFVRCRMWDGKTYWNFAWPQQRPVPVPMTTLQQVASGLKEKMAAARTKGQARKATGTPAGEA